MSHGIVKPFDLVISTEGTEWHKLATPVEVIDDAVAAPLLFPILRSNAIQVPLPNGNTLTLNNHQALVADFSHRADLVNTDNQYSVLHVPKSSYTPIENGQLWESMKQSLKDVDAKVSCIGTLEAGKKFFVSAKLGDGGQFTVNGDKFLANLNIIAGHDGTLAVEAYDSTVRIVCMNTLRWSRDAAGDVKFKVYHTKGADTAMANLGDLVNRILTGRVEFRNNMEYLASQAISASDALEIALGYFATATGTAELAKRSLNAAEEIATLFSRGKGNNGRTLYDLLNGATEFWTIGSGTGKKEDAQGKMYKANFGSAADHKSAFVNLLMSPESVERLREAGRKASSLVVVK